MVDHDDDLPPLGADLGAYFRIVAARLGRVPTLSEVAAFRHEVAGERGRRMRLRRRRKPAIARAPARAGDRGGREADPASEFLTSFEWLAAVSLGLSFIVSLTELASIRIQGGRIAMPKSAMVSPGEGEFLPHPLGSYTPDALMRDFQSTERFRASRRAEMHGDAEYPAAVASLLRSAGKPLGRIGGREAWDVVEATDPAVCRFLRTLGSDPDAWKPLKMDVRLARKAASKAARRFANPEPGDPPIRPGYIDHLLQLSSPEGAAAYCARQFWREKGAEAAALEAVGDMDLDLGAEPPEPTKEVAPHG